MSLKLAMPTTRCTRGIERFDAIAELRQVSDFNGPGTSRIAAPEGFMLQRFDKSQMVPSLIIRHHISISLLAWSLPIMDRDILPFRHPANN